jgi:hypothetical protein
MVRSQIIFRRNLPDMKQNLILPLACLATQIALGEPSLAEKNAAENAAIKKEWESWNTPFQPFRLIGNIHYVGASGKCIVG